MNDFLLEIYGEEIPTSCQSLMKSQFRLIFESFFLKEKISFSELEVYSTSRRICILAKQLLKKKNSKKTEIRGPRTSANEIALDGFMRSNNVKDVKYLKKKIVNGKEYFFFHKELTDKKIEEILLINIPKILNDIKWKKSMRWSSFSEKWIRPIKNIFCIYGEKTIKFNYAGISASNFFYGNYHYSTNQIKCTNVDSYKKKLKEKFVEIDGEDRKKNIYKQLDNFCKKNNLIYKFSDTLVTKVSDSVEWPNIFFGKFDETFFNIPDFILETIITEKQDNFSFRKKNNELSNFFAFVSNKEFSKKDKLISGNQNVLKARFSDAQFFLNEDKKISFSERYAKLSTIVFYDNLGTLQDRSERISDLCKIISKLISYNIGRYSKNLVFSNIDLTTEVVKEFPSLQGQVGGYYAKLEGLDSELCDAFACQYKNTINNKKINISVILSLAQKIDSIFGFFSTQKKISGSGDPFGVRRNVLSIIKILIENRISLNLNILFEECGLIYKKQNIKERVDLTIVFDFFNKRTEGYFIEEGYNHSLVRANLIEKIINPFESFIKVKKLDNFLNSHKGKFFMSAFKRLNSITENSAKISSVVESIFQVKEEKKLYSEIKKLRLQIKKNEDNDNLEIYARIAKPINDFLDNVQVNVTDEKIRKNRKNLLLECRNNLNSHYNFSLLDN